MIRKSRLIDLIGLMVNCDTTTPQTYFVSLVKSDDVVGCAQTLKEVVLLMSLCVAGFAFRSAQASSPHSPEVREIISRHARLISAIHSLEYRGIVKGRVIDTPEGVERVFEKRLKATHGYRFVETRPDSRMGPISQGLGWEQMWIYPNQVLILSPLNRRGKQAFLDTQTIINPKIREYLYDPYLRAIGWISRDPEESVFQPSAWEKQNVPLPMMQNHVCECLGSERRVGYPNGKVLSIRLEGFEEQIWFDPIFRGVIRRRERSTSDGDYKLVWRSDRLQEIDHLIALPLECHREILRHSSNSFSTPVVLSRAQIELASLSVNSLDVSDFEISLPEGTILQDYDTGEFDEPIGGLDMLDDIAVLVSQYGRQVRKRLMLDFASLFLVGFTFAFSCRSFLCYFRNGASQ